MIVVSSFEITESGRRTQPWGVTVGHEYKEGRYYNFRESPELITTHLEDFVEHSDQEAVQIFYSLIRWINGNDAYLKALIAFCQARRKNHLMLHYSGVVIQPKTGLNFSCARLN